MQRKNIAEAVILEMSLKKIGLLIVVCLSAFVILSSAFYYISNSPAETEIIVEPKAFVFLPKGNFTVPFDVLVCTSQPNLNVIVYYEGEVLGSTTTNATGQVLFTVIKPYYTSTGFSASISD